jgi:5-methyltetrahydropteroyltriglutamate--homocysteine methyltransferase
MSLTEERRKRIVTTHVGSLPRSNDLSRLLFARMTHQPYDAERLFWENRKAVREIVSRQIELGIDIVSDGEQSKTSFQYYVTDRLSGIEEITPKQGQRRTRENMAFPAFYRDGAHAGSAQAKFACTGPIRYTGQGQLSADLDNLKAALGDSDPLEVFVPSVSPSSCTGLMENSFYQSDEEHLFAVAEAMREEYSTIVNSGFMVQIDDPRLAMHYMLTPDETVEQSRAWARRRIEALNYALRDISSDRVRHHTCYGINAGPRTSDMEMKHLADLVIMINADYYSFEMANPRHEHEWRVWEHVRLPEGKALLPGCITHASVIVEHPELVAERIVRLARIVGRERVVASSDCGFASTLAPDLPPEIEPEIVWVKLQSLVEGARLATEVLWG